MSVRVLKFGGSSVATVERIQHVAQVILSQHQAGGQLLIVVSAMQGETDKLLALAKAVNPEPDLREMDQLLATGEQVAAALLALALRHVGLKAYSLTAAQMHLQTDGVFSRARIIGLDQDVIRQILQAGHIVVATGFQGIDEQGNITTLGRGGSDTSAVAIAVALGAQECVIYTDVKGVYTADPRLCSKARQIPHISFEEMMEMASLGAKVLQIRSVELAMNYNMPLRVCSSFEDDPGTLVSHVTHHALEHLSVRGITHTNNESKLTLRGLPDLPGVAATVFSALADASISVDVIVQNTAVGGRNDLSFTVLQTDLQRTENLLSSMLTSIEAQSLEVTNVIGKVSIVGVGMMAHPGVAAKMFTCLHQAHIPIEIITTSEIKITCIIASMHVQKAVEVLHDAFALG